MAISKTIPAPPMTVGHYRDAALRHFNTCKVLWRYINLPHTSNLKNINEDFILKNIFYLSGYVVECALKYRYCTNCHTLTDTRVESSWGFPPNRLRKHFSQHANHDKMWSESVVQDLIANNSSSHSIPNHLNNLCRGNVLPAVRLSAVEDILYEMQESWEPTVRYNFENNGLIVNKSDIEAFYNSTKTLLHDFSII
jgi:hypothetical protein